MLKALLKVGSKKAQKRQALGGVVWVKEKALARYPLDAQAVQGKNLGQ